MAEEAVPKSRANDARRCFGQFISRWPGTDAQAAGVGTGSHIDAIPYWVRFDGTVGVLGGLEAIRALQEAGSNPGGPLNFWLSYRKSPRALGWDVREAGCFVEV